MNNFVRCNKINGVYWLKNPIEMLTVKIKTKQQDGLIQLPRFEQYNKSEKKIQNIKECTVDESIFKWQEKVFSRHEIEKYSNVHNCITDTELAYFDLLKNSQCEGSKIFTYTNEDYYKPMPLDGPNKQSDISYLSSCLVKMNLARDEKLGRVFNDGSSSMTHLFRSNEQISSEAEQWLVMHILYDNSQYNEDSQLLLQHDSTLLSLYYNASKNYLILSPDTNDLTFNPYTVEGDDCGLQYAIEISYGEENNGEELIKMLSKLYKKWERKQKQLVNFVVPSLGTRTIHITFEIFSAKDFENDDMYVEYHIKIPDDIQGSGTLKGKTHTTRSLKTEDTKDWKYGHTIDLEMIASTGVVPSPVKVYLEIISTDWWGRHRTEGYAYLPVTLDPGWHSKTLFCQRPEELDVVEAESRRFFVGGCNLLKDFDVLENPLLSTNCRWTTTGSVHVRWRTLTQGAARGLGRGEGGADAALRRYRRAVAVLAAARELYTRETDT